VADQLLLLVQTEHFKSYVTNYHDQVQKPIWVTEYACQNFNGGAQCSWDDTMSFHYEMASWFNEQSWVERYSPFGAMKNVSRASRRFGSMSVTHPCLLCRTRSDARCRGGQPSHGRRWWYHRSRILGRFPMAVSRAALLAC